METPQLLFNWVKSWVAKQRLPTNFQIFPLAGDGSTRQFFRLSVPNSENLILLFDPTWTLSQDYPSHQSYLKTAAIPVPNFLEIDKKAGVLVMEDLGDELLQARIEAQPKTKSIWLESSIRLLAKLHGATFPVSPAIPVSTRRFDAQKYFDEFSFTMEHLHGGLLDLKKVGPDSMKQIRNYCEKLEVIGPEVFAHRDFHCRNLLVHNDKLFMIDFQDARLGPPHYDLASLLYDAYVPITENERSSLLALYQKELKAYSLADGIDWENFTSDLSKVAIQRTIKAAGSFASFYTRFGKKTHLKYLAPALRYSIQLRDCLEQETKSLMGDVPLENWLEQFNALKLV